jgi:hypothetical protein
MATNYLWKVWLRLNQLTKEVDNDYIAEVSTINNTRRNEDIARRIVDDGSEIRYNTILNILNRADEVVRNYLQQGESVLTGNCHLSPRVTGSWLGSSAKYDASVHKITLDMTPSAAMRESLTEVGVEVLGVKESGAYIGLVTDTATGLSDGTITAGDDILIEGDRLKVMPEDEEGLGVFFVGSGGGITPVTRRLTQNEPKTLIARVPELAAGKYTLRVITRFTAGSALLKEPRTIEYEKELTVL